MEDNCSVFLITERESEDLYQNWLRRLDAQNRERNETLGASGEFFCRSENVFNSRSHFFCACERAEMAEIMLLFSYFVQFPGSSSEPQTKNTKSTGGQTKSKESPTEPGNVGSKGSSSSASDKTEPISAQPNSGKMNETDIFFQCHILLYVKVPAGRNSLAKLECEICNWNRCSTQQRMNGREKSKNLLFN